MTSGCAASNVPPLHHDLYMSMLHHDAILDMVAQLIGPSIRFTGEKLNMKSAEFGSVVEWHQDWGFMPHTNDDLWPWASPSTTRPPRTAPCS